MQLWFSPLKKTAWVGAVGLVGLVTLWATQAAACDANNPQVHQSGRLTWCANATFWAAHQADVTPFFAFADQIVPQYAQDFAIDNNESFFIVVMPPVGYASTPTPYGPGINITGDAFYNSAYGIKGFYGYLLMVHEFSNQWTSIAINSGGWPTDFWANHRSPFPNFVDPIVLNELGQPAAAAAQKARFLPGGDTADVQVPMFTSLYEDFGGWDLFRTYFALLRGDSVQWGGLMDPPLYQQQTTFVSGNPSPLLANYVVAYFNLAAGVDVRPRFAAAGVGTMPSNWPADTPWTSYTLDADAIAGITRAHCRIKAASVADQASNLPLLQLGNYNQVFANLAAKAMVQTTHCNDECVIKEARCVPNYLASVADPGPAVAMPVGADPSTDSTAADGTASISTTSAGTAAASGQDSPSTQLTPGTGGVAGGCQAGVEALQLGPAGALWAWWARRSRKQVVA